MDKLREFKRNLEMEEARIASLNASLAEVCDPEFFRLVDILGLDKALELMLALPGVTVKIPEAASIPASINLASAALAASQERMSVAEAAYHYHVNPVRVQNVVNILSKYYRERAAAMAKASDGAMSVEIRQMFSRFKDGDLPDF